MSNSLDELVQNLLHSYDTYPAMTNLQACRLPSRSSMTELTHQLESLLYPGLIDPLHASSGLLYTIGDRVAEARSTLSYLISICLEYASRCPKCRIVPPCTDVPLSVQADAIAHDFFERIPAIRELLYDDLQAAYHGDPAAKSYAEIILSYPGLRALTIHRLAHVLNKAGVPILPRMMSEYVHNRTGIDIHPGAQIGRGLFIDHGTGVVIGETTVIGEHVKIYQGVTLGALSIPDPDDKDLKKRHPTIEDDVTIYSGASILGGNTIVGARSVVGSNVWLTHSVPPDTKILYVQPDLKFKTMDPDMATKKP